jgi:hypothetical protein
MCIEATRSATRNWADGTVAMRAGEALFAIWRQIVADLTPETDRLAVDGTAGFRTLV